MRAYTVAATSVTLRMPLKWVDNLLSHHRLPGVAQARQGVARRLTEEAVVTLEIGLRINRSLAIPMSRCLDLASQLVRAGNSAIELKDGLRLSLDLATIEAEVARRLAHAVEVAPSPRRGRPRR